MDNSKQNSLDRYAREFIKYKAKQLLGKYGFTKTDFEDLKQEMTLDLLRRLPEYFSAKAQRNTFIARVIERKISKLIRYHMQEKRDYRRESCSVNEAVNDGDGNTVEHAQTISQDEHDQRTGKYHRPKAERMDMRLDISFAISGLPPDLKQLAELLKSHSITETARELGIPRSTLYDNGIARLREIFEDKNLREYI